MENLTSILAKKQPHFKSVSPLCTVENALHRMNFEKTDHLIVMDDDENYLGVVTEHDIASKSLYSNLPPSERKVKEIMNTILPIAFTEDSVENCLKSMQRYHVRLLPVFEGHSFKGIITTEDILYEAVWHRDQIFDKD